MSSSISATGAFASTAQVQLPNSDGYTAWCAANGVDQSLVQGWNDAANAAYTKTVKSNPDNTGAAVNQAWTDYVNNMSSSQLQTNCGMAVGNWATNRNYTWQDMKDWLNTTSALYNQANALTGSGLSDNDPAVKQVLHLVTSLSNNAPGSLDAANKYLASLSAPNDTITLSATAQKVLSSTSSTRLTSLTQSSTVDSNASVALAILNAASDNKKDAKSTTTDKKSSSGSTSSLDLLA